jgi:hypothetical protein
MVNIRRDLRQAMATGVETTILAAAVLVGVFAGVWGAEVSNPPGDAELGFSALQPCGFQARTVRQIEEPIIKPRGCEDTEDEVLDTESGVR